MVNAETVGLLGLLIVVLGQFGLVVWWASRLNTQVRALTPLVVAYPDLMAGLATISANVQSLLPLPTVIADLKVAVGAMDTKLTLLWAIYEEQARAEARQRGAMGSPLAPKAREVIAPLFPAKFKEFCKDRMSLDVAVLILKEPALGIGAVHKVMDALNVPFDVALVLMIEYQREESESSAG